MKVPTCEQIFNEELGDPVWVNLSPWRHGVYRTEVYHREADNTHWKAYYEVSSDGESNGLCASTARISQVYPKKILVTQYSDTPVDTLEVGV